jgi:hypothetical protein
MPITLKNLDPTQSASQIPDVYNSNFQAISNYINDLENNLDIVSNQLSIKNISVNQGGITINATGNNKPLIINTNQTNSFEINEMGSAKTLKFFQSEGKWSSQNPQEYNYIKGVTRFGDPTDTNISSDSSGYLAEMYFPSGNNSLNSLMQAISPNLDLYKAPANGGTLSQVMRLNNVQFTKREIWSNNGGQVNGNQFNVVDVTSAASSASALSIQPNSYGRVVFVKNTTGTPQYIELDKTSLEKGEVFWLMGHPESSEDIVLINASGAFESSEIDTSTGGVFDVYSDAYNTTNDEITIQPTTRMHVMNMRLNNDDNLVMLSFKY